MLPGRVRIRRLPLSPGPSPGRRVVPGLSGRAGVRCVRCTRPAAVPGAVVGRPPHRGARRGGRRTTYRGRSPTRRAADRRPAAVHAELLASCLGGRNGKVGPALRAVSDVLGRSWPPTVTAASAWPGVVRGTGSEIGDGRRADDGPLAVLDAVAAMLALGADPATAWRPADLDEDLAPLAAAARRSAAGGAGLAQAVREHAAQLRQETAAASSIRAAWARRGVLMTAPLGLCSPPGLPVLLGLAPVVVGLLGQLHIF